MEGDASRAGSHGWRAVASRQLHREGAGVERVASHLLRLEQFRGTVSLPVILVSGPDLFTLHFDARTFFRARPGQVLPDFCRRCAFHLFGRRAHGCQDEA